MQKLLFSLSVQNEEIPYKNSGFGNFCTEFIVLEFLHQTNLRVSEIHWQNPRTPGACDTHVSM